MEKIRVIARVIGCLAFAALLIFVAYGLLHAFLATAYQARLFHDVP